MVLLQLPVKAAAAPPVAVVCMQSAPRAPASPQRSRATGGAAVAVSAVAARVEASTSPTRASPQRRRAAAAAPAAAPAAAASTSPQRCRAGAATPWGELTRRGRGAGGAGAAASSAPGLAARAEPRAGTSPQRCRARTGACSPTPGAAAAAGATAAAAAATAWQAGGTRPWTDLQAQLRAVSLEYGPSELALATLGWHPSRRLGTGSYGAVYRGELKDGSEVAVKAIDLSELTDKPEGLKDGGFEEEVLLLSKFRHPNLVTLLGWGQRGSSRYLVYEYLAGGDVFQRLRKSRLPASGGTPGAGAPFLWRERLGVCLDAATGLSHMHNSTPKAFHRDIKSANVLLDRHGSAKMADFGLSCISAHAGALHVTTKTVCGTPGYTCPIYQRTGRCTEGSEVHAFGMLALEVLTGLSPSARDSKRPGGLKFPVSEAVRPSESGAIERCLECVEHSAEWPHHLAQELGGLALRCVNAHSEQARPRFVEAVRALRQLSERGAAAWGEGTAPGSGWEDVQTVHTEAASAVEAAASAVAAAAVTGATSSRTAASAKSATMVLAAAAAAAEAETPPRTPPRRCWTPRPAEAAGEAAGASRAALEAATPTPPGPPTPRPTPRPCPASASAAPGKADGTAGVELEELLCSTPRMHPCLAEGDAEANDGTLSMTNKSFSTSCADGRPLSKGELPMFTPRQMGGFIRQEGSDLPKLQVQEAQVPSETATALDRSWPAANTVAWIPAADPHIEEEAPFYLEVLAAEGLDASALPPALRCLPLAASASGLGPQAAVLVGRRHQPRHFEAWLPAQSQRALVSRTAFEVSWVRSSRGFATLLPLGTNPLSVEGRFVRKGAAVALRHGAEVRFSFERRVVLSLRFTLASGPPALSKATPAEPAPPAEPPASGCAGSGSTGVPSSEGGGTASAATERSRSVPARAAVGRQEQYSGFATLRGDDSIEDVNLSSPEIRRKRAAGRLFQPKDNPPAEPPPVRGAWRLVCVGSEELSSGALVALRSQLSGFDLPAGELLCGWGHQPRHFEAWLPNPILRYSTTRSQLRLEVAGDTVTVTNLGLCILSVGGQQMARGESRCVMEGQVLSFARREAGGPVAFLELQLRRG